MRVAVVLSGSIRLYGKSAYVVREWRKDHDVDVHIHTWTNVAGIHHGHWQLPTSTEPTAEILSQYHPKHLVMDDWPEKKAVLERLAKRLEQSSGKSVENLSPLAMYYSMSQAFRLVDGVGEYDVVVRMRFDNLIHDDIFAHRHPGWVIPAECDFGGTNDRFGWMWPDRGDHTKSKDWATAYMDLFPDIEDMLRGGCEYCPEVLLKTSLARRGVPVTRVPFRYSILGFS